MRKPHNGRQPVHSERASKDQEGTLATRVQIAGLIEQFSDPEERRTVDDWPAVARAFVKTARIRGLAIPPWLAAEAGYGEPPLPLRLVHGRAGSADRDIDQEDLDWFEKHCADRTDEGGALIIVGKHVEAMRQPTFECWMQDVDAEIRRLTHPTIGSGDIDFFYRDRYDEGYDPRAVAREAIEEDDMWRQVLEDSDSDADESTAEEAEDEDTP